MSRAEGVDPKADVNYAIQTRLGEYYKNDYVTTQVPLSDAQRREYESDPFNILPPGAVSYNSAGVLLADAMNNRSSLLGGVSFGSSSGGLLGINKYI